MHDHITEQPQALNEILQSETFVPLKLKMEKGGAILAVENLKLPETVNAIGKEWNAKKEFHVTLAGFQLVNKLEKSDFIKSEPAKDARKQKLEKLLQDAADGILFEMKLRPEFRHAQAPIKGPDGKETGEMKESIIVMCEISGMDTFFQRIKEISGIQLDELPPTHVTLFTHGLSEGIGIPNQAKLEELTTPISSADAKALLEK